MLTDILNQKDIELYTGVITKVNNDRIVIKPSSNNLLITGGEVPIRALHTTDFKKGDSLVLVYQQNQILPSQLYHGHTSELLYDQNNLPN